MSGFEPRQCELRNPMIEPHYPKVNFMTSGNTLKTGSFIPILPTSAPQNSVPLTILSCVAGKDAAARDIHLVKR